MSTIYISLPITGVEKQARERADLLKSRLSREGHRVISPFEIYPGAHPTYGDYISFDIRTMLNECDTIYFCKGWEMSCGCQIEHEVARLMMKFRKKNFKIIYE